MLFGPGNAVVKVPPTGGYRCGIGFRCLCRCTRDPFLPFIRAVQLGRLWPAASSLATDRTKSGTSLAKRPKATAGPLPIRHFLLHVWVVVHGEKFLFFLDSLSPNAGTAHGTIKTASASRSGRRA